MISELILRGGFRDYRTRAIVRKPLILNILVNFVHEILRIARRLGERRIVGDEGFVRVSVIGFSRPFASGVGRLESPLP